MGLRTRRLGRTDLAVTEISLGGVAFTSAEQDKSGAIINAALDAGVNYIDVYVGTGKVIGPHLAKINTTFDITHIPGDIMINQTLSRCCCFVN